MPQTSPAKWGKGGLFTTKEKGGRESLNGGLSPPGGGEKSLPHLKRNANDGVG